MATVLPATIDTSKARLPDTYEAATRALAECGRVDECWDWANKAEALASYARQSNDETLHRMADRIRARAVRRCGELLETFRSEGGRPPKTSAATDTSFPQSQRGAAEAAGMSRRQEVTAVRVANVPEPVFEAAIESAAPPTITALAEMGKKPGHSLPVHPRPDHFYAATHTVGAARYFAEFCDRYDPDVVADGLLPAEVPGARDVVTKLNHWLHLFAAALET